ncbi:MAG TPA: hypothetical protein VJO52_07235 [Gemmatimonadaceae bacterium]|nr:hypothetical protein [Gemmatimonadaceae bacterium]
MDRYQRAARVVFAIGLIAMGVLGLVYGDFAMQWQPVPPGVPWRANLAFFCAALELLAGVALLVPRLAGNASRVLVAFVALWLVLLKIPVVAHAPLVEVSWLGLGEIAVILAGAWTLYELCGRAEPSAKGLRRAGILFGLALIPIGLSHIFYTTATASLVPAWLPFHRGVAYFTGAAQVAAGLGVLFSVLPALAATLEATALSIFTIFVWGPGVIGAQAGRLQWTPLIMSTMITAGAWVVAAGVASQHRAEHSAGAA